MWKAHRYSYFLTYGEFDLCLLVLHKCDNPPCINPDHLFLGTQLDNVRDMENKNRAVRSPGEKNGKTILKEKDILEIRFMAECGNTFVKIAKNFGVCESTVSNVVHKRTWTHV